MTAWIGLSLLLLLVSLAQAAELRSKDRELKTLRLEQQEQSSGFRSVIRNQEQEIQGLKRELAEHFVEFYKDDVWTIG